MARPKKVIEGQEAQSIAIEADIPTIDKERINGLLNQIGYFSKDASGPLGMEERLNVASYNMHVFKEIIKELIKE